MLIFLNRISLFEMPHHSVSRRLKLIMRAANLKSRLLFIGSLIIKLTDCISLSQVTVVLYINILRVLSNLLRTPPHTNYSSMTLSSLLNLVATSRFNHDLIATYLDHDYKMMLQKENCTNSVLNITNASVYRLSFKCALYRPCPVFTS